MNNSQIARRMQSVRPSPTAAISDQVRVLEAAGKQVINLGEGELDFATPPHISYAGIEAIVHHQTKYTAVSGTAALKAAIAAKFARDNQLRYRPEEIIAGSGAQAAYFQRLSGNPGRRAAGDYSRALLGLIPGYGLSGRRRTGDCALR